MILTCPSCSKRFLLDAAQLGAGRRVKCGQCGHIWFQKPPAEPASSESAGRFRFDSAAGQDEGSFGGLHDLLEPDRDVGRPDDAVAEPIDPGKTGAWPRARAWARAKPTTTLPAFPKTPNPRRALLLRWGGLAATVASLALALILARTDLVAAWPAAARLYETIGLPVEAMGAGLEFRNVVPEFREIEGNPMLFVKGEIVNTSSVQRPVPDVTAQALDAAGKPFMAWRIVPSARRLFPGQSASFEATAPESGGEAKNVQVIFSEPAPAEAVPAAQ